MTETVWQRIISWIGDQLDRIFSAVAKSPGLTRVFIAIAVTLVAILLARALYQRWQRRDVALARHTRRRADIDDPWSLAASLAARGDHTAAAHALYAALLARLARRERLRRHPSKTAGDYARELRALASPAYQSFRAFARDYDVVVYGIGTCDAARYARLLTLANAVARGGSSEALSA